MTTRIATKRETFGSPIVTIVMRRAAFDRYRAEQDALHQADLDAMVAAGTLVVSESPA